MMPNTVLLLTLCWYLFHSPVTAKSEKLSWNYSLYKRNLIIILPILFWQIVPVKDLLLPSAAIHNCLVRCGRTACKKIIPVFRKKSIFPFCFQIIDKIIGRNIFYSGASCIKYFTHPYFICRSQYFTDFFYKIMAKNFVGPYPCG